MVVVRLHDKVIEVLHDVFQLGFHVDYRRYRKY